MAEEPRFKEGDLVRDPDGFRGYVLDFDYYYVEDDYTPYYYVAILQSDQRRLSLAIYKAQGDWFRYFHVLLGFKKYVVTGTSYLESELELI